MKTPKNPPKHLKKNKPAAAPRRATKSKTAEPAPETGDAEVVGSQADFDAFLPLARALRRFEAEGFAASAADFARRDLLAGHAVRTTPPGAGEGIARGVDAGGALQLETPGGLVSLHSGEVSVRLDAGS